MKRYIAFKLVILLVFAFISCQKTETQAMRVNNFAECALSYDISEAFFTEEDTLVFNLRFVYFSNGDTNGYDEVLLQRQIDILNSVYSPAKVSFRLSSYENIFELPSNKIAGGIDISSKIKTYDIKNYYIFATLFNEPNVINVYIYNVSGDTDFAGVAGGIGSNYLAIRKDYFDKDFKTFSHEIGHCLGLFHTHQVDHTDGYNVTDGDKVCDTPSMRSLSGRVNSLCGLITPFSGDSIQVKNIMSYSYPPCRDKLTEGQIDRIRWFVEQSQDLRDLLYNRHTFLERKLEELWVQ